MKIVLFRNGEPGFKAEMLGGSMPVEEQLETALGGATIIRPMNDLLLLVMLADAEKLGKPMTYTMRRWWEKEAYIVHGDCAAVAFQVPFEIGQEGIYTDITDADFAAANRMILPAGKR